MRISPLRESAHSRTTLSFSRYLSPLWRYCCLIMGSGYWRAHIIIILTGLWVVSIDSRGALRFCSRAKRQFSFRFPFHSCCFRLRLVTRIQSLCILFSIAPSPCFIAYFVPILLPISLSSLLSETAASLHRWRSSSVLVTTAPLVFAPTFCPMARLPGWKRRGGANLLQLPGRSKRRSVRLSISG